MTGVFALSHAAPAGRQFIYKDEWREIHQDYQRASVRDKKTAAAERDRRLAELTRRYEQELMNPEEALKLGSVSRLVPPGYSRKVLGDMLLFLMRHYMSEVTFHAPGVVSVDPRRQFVGLDER